MGPDRLWALNRLWALTDGELEARGPGLSALGEFDVSRARNEAFCGRWMRPDQSNPVRAGILSVEVYDGGGPARLYVSIAYSFFTIILGCFVFISMSACTYTDVSYTTAATTAVTLPQ